MDRNQLYLIKSGENSFVETEGEATIGLSGGNIGFGTTHPEAFMHVTGNTQIDGDLTVKGDFTTVNSTTIQVDDKNIEIGVGATTDMGADGGGITLHGATNKTINWSNENDAWTSSEHVHTADGKHVATDQVRALDGDGLKLYDDEGNGIFVEDGGNVGVGTSNPSSELDVVGSGNFSASVSAGTSVDATTTMSAGTSLTTPLVKAVDANGLNLQDDGGNGIFVEDGGNVGVGTSNPSSELDVVGSGNFSASVSAGTSVDATTTMSAGTSLTTPLVKAVDANGLNLQDDGGNGIFVEDGGNVGVGTSNPSSELDVVGSGNFSAGLYVNGNAVVTGDAGKWEDGVGSDAIYYSAGNVGIGTSDPSSELDVVGSGNFSQGLFVDGNPVVTGAGGKWSDGVGTNEIYYSAANVGIGTSNPAAPLDVAGLFQVGSDGAIGGISPLGDHVIKWNGSKWISSSSPGGGGASSSEVPSAFTTNLLASNGAIHQISFTETYDSIPSISTDLEVTEGPIIPYAISGLSTDGYYAVFTQDIPADNNYKVHTTFGGKEVYWGTGVTSTSVVYNDGNVGIGTSNPNVALDVVGGGSYSNDLTVGGTVDTSNLTFDQINGSAGASNNDVIAYNGSAWTVKAASQLGIGGGSSSSQAPDSFVTSVPNGASQLAIPFAETYDNVPQIAATVEVDGMGEIIPHTVSGVSETGYHVVFAENVPNSNYSVHTLFGSKDVYWETGVSDLQYGTNDVKIGQNLTVSGLFYGDQVRANSAAGLRLQDDGGNGIFIKDGGDVGIGTTNPGQPLHIYSSNTSSTGMRLTNGANTSYYADFSNGFIKGYGSNTSFKITLNDSEKLRIKDDGNVGIGTANPGQFSGLFINRSALSVGGQFPGQLELGVNATAYSSNVTGTGALMFMDYSNTATGITSKSQFVAGISGLTVSAESTTNPAQNAGGALRFWVKPVNGIPDEKMRLSEDGNLAIYNLTASADVVTDPSKKLTTSSDKRLKNDLGDCEYGLTEVLQVQPKKYTWKEGPEDQKPTVGFFAQDVHAIMPEAAPKESVYDQDSNPVLDENGEQDYRWGLNSQTIIAALVNATKEQQQIIEDLKSRIETLEQ